MPRKDIVVAIDNADSSVAQAVKAISKELGYPLKGIILTDNNDFLEYWNFSRDDSGFFKEVQLSYNDGDSLQRTLKGIAERTLVVLTQSECSIEHFKKVIPFFPYCYLPTESSLIWAHEKQFMRRRLKVYDEELVPRYTYLKKSELSVLDEKIKGFTFPVIIKPGSLSAQMLVDECTNKRELKQKLTHAFGLIQSLYDQELSKSEPVLLIEEMIRGDMYTTDAYIAHDGTIYCLPLIKIITAHSQGLPGFYDYRMIAPVTDLDAHDTKAGFAAARKAVLATNLRSTTAHIEMFKTKDGWKIIELAARMGGDREEVYEQVYGIDHSYNDVAIRAGLRPKIPKKVKKYLTNDLIFAEEEGIIESIEGVEEVRQLQSHAYVKVHGKPGEKALFSVNGGEYLVDVVLAHKDQAQVERDTQAMRRLIKVVVKPAK